MRFVSLLSASCLSCVLAGVLGCEPEIGGLCDPEAADVEQAIEVREGTNNLVQDVSLENCTQAFCASVEGSRAFCTKRCEADAECAEAGPGFVCQEIVSFGPLACGDYEDPLLPQPGTDPSGDACQGNSECGGDEQCFPTGDLAETCGVPGRDCLTGEQAGAQSAVPLKYCGASPQVIAERDRAYGRAP